MIKKLFILFMAIFMFASVSAQAGTKVWFYPTGTLNPEVITSGTAFQITKVEFKPDETLVHMHMTKNKWYENFRFAPETNLISNGKAYHLISAEGITPGEWHSIDPTGSEEYVFHFEAMPQSTESFDFIEWLPTPKGGSYSLYGVAPRGNILEGSNWRNDITGDWIIGFFPDFAIYDTKIWKYADKDFSPGQFILTDGVKEVMVKAGKEKDGKRKLKIDDKKEIPVSRISSMFLPDYPGEGGVTEFIDNGFREGDSVTIRGYLKDLPEDTKIDNVTVSYRNLITDQIDCFNTPIDPEGNFCINFPVINTQKILISLDGIRIEVPVEPNEDYFLFYDFANGQNLWMGERSRLLNELTAHRYCEIPRDAYNFQNTELLDYLNAFKERVDNRIDSVATAVPGISPLWKRLLKESMAEDIAMHIGQQRYGSYQYELPKCFWDYVYENIWKNLPEVPTAWNPEKLSTFLRDFIDDTSMNSPYYLKFPMNLKYPIWSFKQLDPKKYDSIKEDVERIRTEIDSLYKVPDLEVPPHSLYEHMEKIVENAQDSSKTFKFKIYLATLDSLNASPAIRDIMIARELTRKINTEKSALDPEHETMIDRCISLPVARNYAHRINDYYKNLKLADVEPGNGKMVPQEELNGITSGKELLDKITKPFRGHLILVDVWGAWCGPCKDAFRFFKEEKEALDPYGVVFMFFANCSTEENCNKIIEEYDVTGDNVIHYNLPAEQEALIEKYLNITGYPGYRLLNTDGSVMDVSADPRYSIYELKSLIQNLKDSSPK